MPNPFVYVQLHTTDHEKAKQFYTNLFGWKLEDIPGNMPKYTEVIVGESTVAGIMPTATPEIPSRWVPFVHVDNVTESTEKARALGASIIVKPTNIPGKGQYSLISDPTGAMMALFTSSHPG